MMSAQTIHHTLSDGRTLAYCQYGDPQGIPLFFAHGSPGSRLEGELFHESALKHGFRLIATDRPGMGQSTFKPNRQLLDYPKDMLELADAMDIDKFGMIGWSGGGAHTAVCGYALPERLLFNIALAGYTNFGQLPGAADMLKAKADRISVKLSQKFPRLFQLFFGMMAFSIRYFPNAYYNSVARAVNESDKEIMADPAFKRYFIADQKEAFAQGSRGVTLDAAVHYVDWGIRLNDIATKLHVFHGTEDTLVPVAFGQHLAKNVPDCAFHLLDKQGHLFPATHQALIFAAAQAER
jgi:pimeloyl-ACP methyl ester carboxylesterase